MIDKKIFILSIALIFSFSCGGGEKSGLSPSDSATGTTAIGTTPSGTTQTGTTAPSPGAKTTPLYPSSVVGDQYLIVVAPQEVQGEEYDWVYNRLIDARVNEANIKIASISKDLTQSSGWYWAKKMDGRLIPINTLLDQSPVKDDIDNFVASFKAVIFIGGPGANQYNAHLPDGEYPLKIAEAASKDPNVKVVAAICLAPLILANAGVLKDKEATVFTDPQSTDYYCNYLEKASYHEHGAIPVGVKNCVRDSTNKTVRIDGKIITASGPDAANEFSQEILRMLGL